LRGTEKQCERENGFVHGRLRVWCEKLYTGILVLNINETIQQI